MPKRTVIWDWNGTLLDDVDCCVATLNTLRGQRQLAALSREDYRRQFGFPVRAFYEQIGFDFPTDDDFALLSQHFIAEYCGRGTEMRVATSAPGTLARLAARGVDHLVVSAMEHRLLGEMLASHQLLPHLMPHLGGYQGRPDHSAGSKVEIGAAAVRSLGRDPGALLVVGDTLHDLELARAIGASVVLYAGGHQSRERLEGAGVPVIDDLSELERML
jgi:phosphoglycolate phosphatase